jgi:hypothetical protein
MPGEHRVVVAGVLPDDAWPTVGELLAGRPDVALTLQRGDDLMEPAGLGRDPAPEPHLN